MESNAIRPLAIVTGASSGIGYYLACQAAEHGYDLLIAADQPQLAGKDMRARGRLQSVRRFVLCRLAQ